MNDIKYPLTTVNGNGKEVLETSFTEVTARVKENAIEK